MGLDKPKILTCCPYNVTNRLRCELQKVRFIYFEGWYSMEPGSYEGRISHYLPYCILTCWGHREIQRYSKKTKKKHKKILVESWLMPPISPLHLTARLSRLLHNTIWQIPALTSARETGTKNASLFISPHHITIRWFGRYGRSMRLYSRVQQTCSLMSSRS